MVVPESESSCTDSSRSTSEEVAARTELSCFQKSWRHFICRSGWLQNNARRLCRSQSTSTIPPHLRLYHILPHTTTDPPVPPNSRPVHRSEIDQKASRSIHLEKVAKQLEVPRSFTSRLSQSDPAASNYRPLAFSFARAVNTNPSLLRQLYQAQFPQRSR